MNQALIVELIHNAGLLLSMVLLFDFLTSRQKLFNSRRQSIVSGLALGVIGVVMIRGAVPLEAGIVFDTRSVLLAVSGLFFGILPTTIAMVLMALYRLLLGGAADWTGVSVILSSGLIGIAWRRWRPGTLENISWPDLLALGVMVHLVMLGLMFTLPLEAALRVVEAIGVPVMVIHPLATMLVGLFFAQRLRYHQTTEELKKSESAFRLLAENARDLVYRFEFKPITRFAYVSPSSTEITGYTPEEYYADPDLRFRLVHLKEGDLLEALRRGEITTDQPIVRRWVRKDGEVIWVEQRNTYILDDHGEIAAVEGIVGDITADKQTDLMIRAALRAASQGLYDLNVQTGEAVVSEEYARMLGFDPATFRETHQAWVERLHPDDREPAAAAYRDYIEGRRPEYRVEFRQPTTTGEWRWILSLGSIVAWDAEGRPLHMVGTNTDITPLKLAEQQTREAQAETARLLMETEQSRRALLSLVEDQREAELNLLVAQELAQSTLDALEEHICVVDGNGIIIAVNRAWREFGSANGARPEATLVGASYLAVCDRAAGEGAEEAREGAEALRSVLAGRSDSFALEYPCHSAQEERWFHLQVTRFGDGRAVMTHENITERRRADTHLRHLTEILEATQAAARVGVWELDLVHESLFWTDETYRIHDISPAAYTPALDTALEFFTPESRPLLQDALKQATEQGAPRDLELELITGQGARKWVHFATSVTREQGRTARITCAIQDITARKEAERGRLELTRQLHQAQKLESLGSLAGGVAHDINNVLAAILSLSSVHRAQLQDTDPLARSLDTITNACVRGRSVVRSLLYFARNDIESAGTADINAIVRQLVDLLVNTTLRRVHFSVELEEPLPTVDGDVGALSHAVMNLCVNAIDAMPEGGSVTIRTRSRADGMVEISVRDTGTGMTEEVREKAIDPFFTTKPVGKGTGLGLAMVYGTVKAHKGTFEIISAPGKGTEVVLGFPANPLDRFRSVLPEKPLESAAPVEKGPLRILLVDDDELIREAVGSLLEIEGHEMRLAEGGAQALALFEEGLDVDLVILDMNMPGLNGAQTLQRLLKIRPDQVVLMCSGHSDEEMALAMMDHPHVLSIQKPFTLDELQAKIQELGFQSPA